MTRVGTSTFIINNLFVDTSQYRGATGPTGPAGNTGPDGLTGATGATGNGISFILYTNTDGVTIYLVDATEIFLNGLSGNTYTDFTSTNPDEYYKVSGVTGIIPNNSFEIKGAVLGLTASFKSIKFIGGLTARYVNNDLVVGGVTLSGGYALGEFGSALRSRGNTAETFPAAVFEYEVNTVGATTVHIAKIAMSQFAQNTSNTNNKNINSLTEDINDFITGSTANIGFNQYEQDSGFLDKTNRTTVFAENTKIGGLTGPRIIFRSEVVYALDGGIGTDFSPYEYGSCCYCDANANGRPRCIDYVNKTLCDSLTNGVFSQDSCASRRTGNCVDSGKCCFPNGACANLSSFDCLRLGGTYTRGAMCAGSTCTP
jgi:hypothetical protein